MRTIRTYRKSADLIDDLRPEFFDHLQEDQIDTLLHLEDFEPLGYVVIDDQQVVCYDTISGDVYDQMSIDAWLGATWYALTD